MSAIRPASAGQFSDRCIASRPGEQAAPPSVVPVWHASAVVSIGAVAERGLPVYPDIDAAQRYGVLYGPLTYLRFIPVFALFGHTLTAAKLLGALCLIITLASAYVIGRQWHARPDAMMGVGALSLVLLHFGFASFDTRADSALVAAIGVGTAVAWSGRGWAVFFTVTAVTAVVPNLKLNAAAALLPLLTLVWVRHGWRLAAAAAAAGAGVACLPFLLPNVSLTNYLATLDVARAHGLSGELLSRNMQWAILLLLPLGTVAWPVRRSLPPGASACLAATVVGMLLMSVSGAKPGSGEWHLMPFLPSLLLLFFWCTAQPLPVRRATNDRLASLAPAYAVTLLAYICFAGGGIVRHARLVLAEAPRHARAIEQIRAIVPEYRGRNVEIGYGERYDGITELKTLLVLGGHSYTVDTFAIADHQLAGIPMPPATVAYLESCQTPVWLIPADAEPFRLENPYPSLRGRRLFPDAFRETFVRRYERVARGEVFDVWSCRQ